jgi:hypothetical protein
MRLVDRSEILDYVSYGEHRQEILDEVFRQKQPRRIHVGSWLTFLFENHDTVRFQIQEMVRVEQIVKEVDIEHEIETYNELLGSEGQLGATLLIEIDTVEKRQELLKRWMDLPEHLYVKLEDGEKVYAGYDNRQVGEDRLSSVQYLTFDTKGRGPVAIGADHEFLAEETELTEEQREALRADLE